MENRRTTPPPTDTAGYLRSLTGHVLMDRLPLAMMGVEGDGSLGYANSACVEMLGYSKAQEIDRVSLSTLLTGHEMRSPAECLATLRKPGAIVGWNHHDGYEIRTMVSPPILLRGSDTLVLIGLTDLTQWLWETGRGSGPVVDASQRHASRLGDQPR